ncbi:MAG: hypothetical protein PUP91_18045 [Rhizonema sp. PD37]|nr:hypothetical protein [Rhizonema sp. PD37]
METVNGKLITQELKQFDELTQKNEKINQRFESLEAQLITMSKQDYTQYLETISQEVDSHKSSLQKLDQKIGFLEDSISRQAKQVLFFKLSLVFVLLGFGFTFFTNNQPQYEKAKPKKKTESLELVKPKSRDRLFIDI